MKKRNLLFLGFSLVLLSNCVTSSFIKSGETFPRHEGPVKVLGKYPAGVDFFEIGIVSSKYGILRNDADLVKALLKKAAKHGANAIIILPNPRTHRSSLPPGPYGVYGGIQTNNDMTAIAIRIKNAEQTL